MSPATFIKDDTNNEKELHDLIEKDIEALEPGIKILKHEFQCGDRGTVDFLYADSGNRLGLIEVKKDTDEDVLFQGLRYYSWIDKNRYAVASMFPKDKIDPSENPRLTLIAKSFSDDVRSLSTYVNPDVELYEYSVLKYKEIERGLCFHPVSLPKVYEMPGEAMTEKDLINYITDENLKKLFKEIIEKVTTFNSKIKKYNTEGYIGFQYNGRQIAYFSPHRKSFDVGAVKLDDKLSIIDYPFTRIVKGNEDYSTQIEIIKENLEKLDAK